MRFLIDINILLRLIDSTHPQFAESEAAVNKLDARGVEMRLVSQSMYVGWTTLTRPKAVNGFGKTPAEAEVILDGWAADHPLLDDEPTVRPNWYRLVRTHRVIGKKAHDARLVGAMSTHALTHLLTFNDADFRRFAGITVLTPAEVLALL